jgi:nitroimidazol reductase NimA-like FMN-containing flavoprotein (pyridoxamine 5'-phosphate oxidase superfamily)
MLIYKNERLVTAVNEMRRKDREMDEEFARSVIDRSEFGTLATVNEDGTPYCIPLSTARIDNRVYFHAAREGQKIDNIKRSPKVCLSYACGVHVPPVEVDTFTTEFESAVIFGTASIVEDEDERLAALRLISEKFTPDSMPFFESAAESGLKLASIVRIDIERITGKRKKYGKDGKEMKWGRME